MTQPAFTLRPYRAGDEEAAHALWLRSWQTAYPAIDFAARLKWWRERWRDELLPNVTVIVAEQDGALAGYVTIDPANGYLDQLVVAPAWWGSPVASALVAEAKHQAPAGVTLLVNTDNARALAFYQREGFAVVGDDVNPVSGRPVLRMAWRP